MDKHQVLSQGNVPIALSAAVKNEPIKPKKEEDADTPMPDTREVVDLSSPGKGQPPAVEQNSVATRNNRTASLSETPTMSKETNSSLGNTVKRSASEEALTTGPRQVKAEETSRQNDEEVPRAQHAEQLTTVKEGNTAVTLEDLQKCFRSQEIQAEKRNSGLVERIEEILAKKDADFEANLERIEGFTDDCLKLSLSGGSFRLTRDFESLREMDNLRASNAELESRVKYLQTRDQGMVELLKKAKVSRQNIQKLKDDALKEAKELGEMRVRETKQLKEEEEKLKRRLETAEGQASLEAEEKQSLNTKLSATQKELVKFQQATKNQQGNIPKTSDDEIENSWRQLAFNIGQLAKRLAQHIPARGHLTMEETQQRFCDIVRSYRDVLLSPHSGTPLLQAYIWRAVDKCRLPEDIPLAASARQFEDLRLRMLSRLTSEGAATFASWFAEGWKSLHLELKECKKALDIAAIAEAKLLFDFIPDAGTNPADVRRLEEALLDIFQHAHDLDCVMGVFKAVFKRTYPIFKAPYEPWWMEVEGYGERPRPFAKVLFSVSPSLMKYGNADGHYYHSHIVLSKAGVVMQDTFENSRLSITNVKISITEV